jgi:hypothetical protein
MWASPLSVGEAEFLEAGSKYGYSKDFQQACYQAAREAMDVANRWVPGECLRWKPEKTRE